MAPQKSKADKDQEKLAIVAVRQPAFILSARTRDVKVKFEQDAHCRGVRDIEKWTAEVVILTQYITSNFFSLYKLPRLIRNLEERFVWMSCCKEKASLELLKHRRRSLGYRTRCPRS